MQRYILRRLVQGAVLLFVLALVVFALARVTGNPADLLLPRTRRARMRPTSAHAGLDRPARAAPAFLGGPCAATSASRSLPQVGDRGVFERLPNTLSLVPLHGRRHPDLRPLGVMAAVHRGTFSTVLQRRRRARHRDTSF